MILARLAFGTWLDPADVRTSPTTAAGRRAPGITGVDARRHRGRAVRGRAIKLVAEAVGRRRRRDGTIAASVLPTRGPGGPPFGRTAGVLNRIEVEAEPVGTVGLQRARAPADAATASAVLGDLIAIARGPRRAPGRGRRGRRRPRVDRPASRPSTPVR